MWPGIAALLQNPPQVVPIVTDALISAIRISATIIYSGPRVTITFENAALANQWSFARRKIEQDLNGLDHGTHEILTKSEVESLRRRGDQWDEVDKAMVEAIGHQLLAGDKYSAHVKAIREERDNLKKELAEAQSLIARMYRAAVGHDGGPSRGIVEDIEDLRSKLREKENEEKACWAAMAGEVYMDLSLPENIDKLHHNLRRVRFQIVAQTPALARKIYQAIKQYPQWGVDDYKHLLRESLSNMVKLVENEAEDEEVPAQIHAVSDLLKYRLDHLQAHLPWTIHYHRDFRASPVSHKDFQHALIHVFKAAGKLADIVNDAEHAGTDWHNPKIADYIADLVICALRMSNTIPLPAKVINLAEAVVRRIESKNEVKL